MPIPEHPPELQRLLLLIEGNLHYLVRLDLNREQALDIKRRIALPLGVLNKKHNFRSDLEAKAIARNGHAIMSIDIKT